MTKRAEDGHVYEATNPCNCSWGASITGPSGQDAVLNFVWYSNQQVYPCGPDSYWIFKQLGLIAVTIPIVSGTLDFSNMSIGAGPGNDYYGCTTTTTTQQPGFLTWFTTYGESKYSVALNTDTIQQGQNITATFVLTNVSNQTQTVDLAGPLVLPTIYSQDGKVVWAYQPSADTNAIQNITAGQAITEQMVLPTWSLQGGQSYTLNTSPGVWTAPVNIGSHLELNQTITVA